MLYYLMPSGERRPSGAWHGPLYDDDVFERDFRLSRALFKRVYHGPQADSEFIRTNLNPDVTGKFAVKSKQIFLSTMCQLTNGITAESRTSIVHWASLLRFNLSSSSAHVLLTHAQSYLRPKSTGSTRAFGPLYLREHNNTNISRMGAAFSQAGFPRTIGTLDCTEWQWNRCLKYLQGAHITCAFSAL